MKLSLTPEVPSSPIDCGPRRARELDRPLPMGLPLCGSLPVMQQLRLQVQITSRHLRTAVIEIEPGLGDQAIAMEIAHLSVQGGRPLFTVEAATLNAAVADGGLAGARELLDISNARVVYLRELSLLSPLAQRIVAELLSSSNSLTRWIFSTRLPLRTLRVRGLLAPELLQRLSTITLRVPPLRERLDDLPELAAFLLSTIAEHHDVPTVSAPALALLRSLPWHSNLAELYSVLRASALTLAGKVLCDAQIRAHLWTAPPAMRESAAAEPRPTGSATATRHQADSLPVHMPAVHAPAGQAGSSMRLEDVIDQHLLFVLARCGGNKLRAAEMLHISRSTLYRMLDSIARRQQSDAA